MKKLLLVLVLLLVTGCSGEYNLTITDEKKVNEKFILSINNQEILDSATTVDEYLDYHLNLYSSSDNFKKYNIKAKKSKPNSYFLVERSYKDLDEYIESNSFKSMFLYADLESTSKYVTFKTSRNDYIYSLQNEILASETEKYDSFEINIKFYNEVINHNADKVDKSNNIYTWYVDETRDADESYIYFKLGPKVKYLVKIKDIIMNNLASIIVIGSTLLLIAGAILYIMYKNKKNNEI